MMLYRILLVIGFVFALFMAIYTFIKNIKDKRGNL